MRNCCILLHSPVRYWDSVICSLAGGRLELRLLLGGWEVIGS